MATVIIDKTGWSNVILTPAEVRTKLAVVSTDFEKVIKRAEKTGKNIVYWYTVFGCSKYPMHLELTSYSR